jgi:hypothetical protein
MEKKGFLFIKMREKNKDKRQKTKDKRQNRTIEHLNRRMQNKELLTPITT